MLEKLQENIKLSLEFGISPTIVVNFVNSCKSEEEIKTAFDIILNVSRLTKKDIVMVDNYETEEYRNTEKDLVYWSIMKKIMKEVEKNFKLEELRFEGLYDTPIIHSISPNDKYCFSENCNNYGEVVSFPMCPFCGKEPKTKKKEMTVEVEEVSEIKMCDTNGCSNNGKVVNFPLCPFCGKKPVSNTPRCCTTNCSNKGKVVNFPLCPYCGKKPSSGSEPEVEKKRKCINRNCSHYDNIVQDGFPLCPYCGSEPCLK